MKDKDIINEINDLNSDLYKFILEFKSSWKPSKVKFLEFVFPKPESFKVPLYKLKEKTIKTYSNKITILLFFKDNSVIDFYMNSHKNWMYVHKIPFKHPYLPTLYKIYKYFKINQQLKEL